MRIRSRVWEYSGADDRANAIPQVGRRPTAPTWGSRFATAAPRPPVARSQVRQTNPASANSTTALIRQVAIVTQAAR